MRRRFFFFNSSAQMADTRLESTPPERKVQTGTSAESCRRTASRMRKPVFSTVSSQLSSWGRLSSSQ